MIITINLDVPSMRSKKNAEDFALQVASHIEETFNDDNSIIWTYWEVATKAAVKRRRRARS